MGGKSTLLRMSALAVVLAQMGAHVPAEAATLSVVDKVFTRAGALDRLLQQESTFFVELNESASTSVGARSHLKALHPPVGFFL